MKQNNIQRDATNDRKVEHIRVIHEDAGVDRRKFYFDEIRLRHRALPEVNLGDIDSSTTFLGKPLSFPLLISCMTGGDHTLVRRINRHLAEAAEACGVAMGVGSQRVMFKNPKARASFALRRYAPSAVLLGNLGAVQLNHGFGLSECRAAVDVLQADALVLHLNPLQEAVQPEGDTNFGGLAEKIGAVVRGLDRPIILKEVGAGLSREDVKRMRPHGVRIFDVAGSGGTSWSRIEHHRQTGAQRNDLGLLFQDWGLPTPQALWELRGLRPRVTLIASGGVRNGLDMAKAMILGASLCGVAAPLLEPAMASTGAVIRKIDQLRTEFRTAMFLLGRARVADLINHTAALAVPPFGD